LPYLVISLMCICHIATDFVYGNYSNLIVPPLNMLLSSNDYKYLIVSIKAIKIINLKYFSWQQISAMINNVQLYYLVLTLLFWFSCFGWTRDRLLLGPQLVQPSLPCLPLHTAIITFFFWFNAKQPFQAPEG